MHARIGSPVPRRPERPSQPAPPERSRVLALQRSAGNAAVTRLLQRKPVLADPLTSKYTDPNVSGVELSYITTTGDKRGVFMPYDKYEELRKGMPGVMAEARQYHEEQGRTMDDEAVVRSFFQLEWKKVEPLLAAVYYEEEKGGELKAYKVPGPQTNWFNFSALAQAALHGPLQRDESHGARLPRAEGVLYVIGPNVRYNALAGAADQAALRRDVLVALGVRPAKLNDYGNVTVQAVVDFSAVNPGPQQRIDATARGDIANDLLYVTGARTPLERAFVYADGGWFKPDFSDANPKRKLELANAWAKLAAPAPSAWIPKDQLATATRTSQADAMGKWSAAGAMAYAKNVAAVAETAGVDLTQHFEWLHVRASSLGGLSAPGNLVTGPFVVNSAMTPWEAKLLKWKNKAGAAGTLETRFVPNPASRGPLAKSIVIEIKTKNHPALKDTDLLQVVSFNPIGGQVYDRLGYGIEKSEKLGPERKPYDTRAQYGPAVTAVQSGQPVGPTKTAAVALNDYDTALRRLEGGEAAPANPSAQAADTAYRAALANLRQGLPISATDPAHLTAAREYLAAVVALQAGNPVGAGPAAQGAQTDYTQAVDVLHWWHPDNPVGPLPSTIALATNHAAQAAFADYTTAWTNLYNAAAVATNVAAAAAQESFKRKTQSKTKRQ